MPKKLHGRKLTPALHRQWRRVYEKTGKGAIATAAVEKTMGMRPKKKMGSMMK